MPRGSSWRGRLALGVVAAALLGCTSVEPGSSASEHRVAGGAVPLDEVVDGHIADLETYWTRELPATYGVELDPVDRVASYRGSDPSTHPRCNSVVGDASLYADNALYCRIEHVIVYDADAFAQMREDHGPLAVGLVLAHEYAHAVQATAQQKGETLDLELQADCLSGAWAADRTRSQPGARAADLDAAVRVILDSADPVGSPIGERDVHGSAFRRLAAFSEGFHEGTAACDLPGDGAGEIATPEEVTATTTSTWTGSVADLADALDEFWSAAGAASSGTALPFERDRGEATCGRAPICIEHGVVRYDDRTLRAAGGRWSVGYPVAAAYGQAQLIAAGSAPATDEAILAADCAVGAFVAAAAVAPSDRLRTDARDLDEIVAAMGTFDPARLWPERDGTVSYLARVEALRTGVSDGIDSCPATVTG